MIIGDQVPSGGAAAMAMRSAVAPLASGPVTSPVDIPAEPVAISLEDFEILSGTKHDRKLLTGAIEILNHSSTAIGIVRYIRKEENNQKIKLFMREKNGDEVLTRYDAESKTVFWDPTLKTWLGIECTVPDTAECDHHGPYFKKKPFPPEIFLIHEIGHFKQVHEYFKGDGVIANKFATSEFFTLERRCCPNQAASHDFPSPR